MTDDNEATARAYVDAFTDDLAALVERYGGHLAALGLPEADNRAIVRTVSKVLHAMGTTGLAGTGPPAPPNRAARRRHRG